MVAITGAGGRIGRNLWPALAPEYRLRLADRRPVEGEDHETIVGNVGDPEIARRICEGADTVIHLAADPNMEATWESLVPNNIDATHTLMRAAVAAGVRRFVFASSVNASLRLDGREQFREERAPEPTNLYGASKVLGEALGSVFAEQGLSVICLRIGAYQERVPASEWLRPMWLSPRDFNAIARLAIEKEGIRYLVVHAVSNNYPLRMSLARASEALGYSPEDNAFAPNVPGTPSDGTR